MTTSATTYLRITQAVEALVREHAENYPTACRYMIARAALLGVVTTHGSEKAGQLAYKIADDLSTGSGR